MWWHPENKKPLTGGGTVLCLALAALVLMPALLSGCGYNFAGDGPLAIPKNIKTLYIVEFNNPTLETGLNPYVRAMLRDEFTRRGVKWASKEHADGFVTITILNSRTDSWHDAYDRSFTRVSLRMSVQIKNAADNSLLWDSGAVSRSDTYMYDLALSQEQLIQELVKDIGDRLTQAY